MVLKSFILCTVPNPIDKRCHEECQDKNNQRRPVDFCTEHVDFRCQTILVRCRYHLLNHLGRLQSYWLHRRFDVPSPVKPDLEKGGVLEEAHRHKRYADQKPDSQRCHGLCLNLINEKFTVIS